MHIYIYITQTRCGLSRNAHDFSFDRLYASYLDIKDLDHGWVGLVSVSPFSIKQSVDHFTQSSGVMTVCLILPKVAMLGEAGLDEIKKCDKTIPSKIGPLGRSDTRGTIIRTHSMASLGPLYSTYINDA
jgi:hypothetical protein